MIQLNIHHIPEEGLSIDTTVPVEELHLEKDKRITDITPLVCELKASMVDKDLVVRGSSTMVLNCKCDRCLCDMEEVIESDDICIVIENSPEIVDLTNDIREDILLAFPQLFLCKSDCKGLCFSCGQDLNEDQCHCGEQTDEDSPWDTLDKLNFDDHK